MSNIKIQLYHSAQDNKGQETDLQQIIEIIAGRVGASANIEQKQIRIRELLSSGKQDEAKELKTSLPAVTWCGTFAPTRAIKNLQQYNPFQIFDIDKLPPHEVQPLFEKLQADPLIHLAFISPGGAGIKGLIKTDATADRHKEYFKAVEKYFYDTYTIKIDESGKDVSRLCFLPVHYHLHYQPGSNIFSVAPAEPEITDAEKKKLTKATAAEKKQLQASGQQCNDIWESTQQVIDYREGNRNNFILKFACNCNRVGISQMECESFALAATTEHPAQRTKAAIDWAYKNNINEHGQYKRTAKTATTKSNNGTQLYGNTNSGSNGIKIDKFWKEHTFKKGKGKNAHTETKYEIVRRELLLFLFNQGFHLIRTSDSNGKQFVYSKGGVVKPIDTDEIKQHVLAWCQKNDLPDIEEQILKAQTKLFSPSELTSLKYKEICIAKDSEAATYFYFQNCYVVIDNEGNITPKDYSTLATQIWESSKIKHDYKEVTNKILGSDNLLLPHKQIECEFARFIALVSHNPDNEEEAHLTRHQVTERFYSFCSAIGYMLCGYKHPSDRKGIFAVDHKISERGEAHGRTGKSLIPQACLRLKKVATINGTGYDPKYQFRDEPITIDTKIINFNDLPPNFDIRHLFEKIADPYSINRRNNGFINFTYEDSPIVYGSMNYTPKGEGSSYKARMHVIEFSDYFSDTHSPYREFGHGFFETGWDENEWQRFYNFMLWCVGYYKSQGLIDYPNPNLEARKLVYDVVPEFVDFMDDPEYVQKNTRLKKVEVMTTFNEKFYYPLYNKKITPHSFTGWLRKFCNSKGYTLNPKQKGKHDKSNSVEYITIADANWKDEQTKLL